MNSLLLVCILLLVLIFITQIVFLFKIAKKPDSLYFQKLYEDLKRDFNQLKQDVKEENGRRNNTLVEDFKKLESHIKDDYKILDKNIQQLNIASNEINSSNQNLTEKFNKFGQNLISQLGKWIENNRITVKSQDDNYNTLNIKVDNIQNIIQKNNNIFLTELTLKFQQTIQNLEVKIKDDIHKNNTALSTELTSQFQQVIQALEKKLANQLTTVQDNTKQNNTALSTELTAQFKTTIQALETQLTAVQNDAKQNNAVLSTGLTTAIQDLEKQLASQLIAVQDNAKQNNTALSTELTAQFKTTIQALEKQLASQLTAVEHEAKQSNTALSIELSGQSQQAIEELETKPNTNLDDVEQNSTDLSINKEVWGNIEKYLSSYINDSVTHEAFEYDKYALNFHETQLDKDSLEERELIIGLDFGSSTTKVVIRDTSTKKTYAIKFYEFEENAYLKSTCIFIDDDEFNFSHGEKLDHLKINLINKQHQNLEYTIAYLALIFRYIRYYFLTHKEYKNIYHNTQLVWRINIGLPAKNCDDIILKKSFKLAALSGWNASVKKGGITKQIVNEALQLSREPYNDENDRLHPEAVEVLPEVIAEIVGYAKSSLGQEGLHLLIDIGAMTTDVATFYLDKNKYKYSIYSTEVKHLGVYELQKNILIQAGEKIIDDSVFIENDKEKIQQELKKYVEEININSFEDFNSIVGNLTDDILIGQFKQQIVNVFNDTWQHRISHWDQDDLRKTKPFLLFVCGGGSKIAIYRNAVNDCSKNLQKNLRLCGFLDKSLPEPKGFEAPDLPPNSFHRMAVAYGLSFPAEEIGNIIPQSEIPDIEKSQISRRENYGDNYEK